MKYSIIDQEKRAHNIYESENQVVTHLNIKKGEEIPSHDSPMTVIVVIYQGEVSFTEEGETFVIKPGDIVSLKPGVSHSLLAKEDSKLMVIKSKLAE